MPRSFNLSAEELKLGTLGGCHMGEQSTHMATQTAGAADEPPVADVVAFDVADADGRDSDCVGELALDMNLFKVYNGSRADVNKSWHTTATAVLCIVITLGVRALASIVAFVIPRISPPAGARDRRDPRYLGTLRV